jgi:hypothetical protein
MKIRHLNKIIFIKSADIDYQEISLNGNVHFTGDQGVGKSTVLRAILFFYNARTDKLGINTGDENFLEFYFKYPNSHIIYEIQTEHNKFTVWLTKEGNRPAYRLIDAEFQKDFFFENTTTGFQPLQIDDIKHNIRENNITISRKIFLFNEFRDIIYGANKDNKYVPYAIMQSPVYQNVPNTITNIFLNAQLNSDKIKQTIIHSLIGEEQNENKTKYQIDLPTIRKDLSEFEQDFNDISDFDKTKIKAQKIILLANDFKKKEQEKIANAQNLGESLLFYQNEINIIKSEFNNTKQELKISNNKINELKEKHTKTEKEIEDKITILENDISKAQQKQKYWINVKANGDLIGIENILKKVAEEKQLQNANKSKIDELQTLKIRFDSIEQKYKILFQQIENDKNTSINTINTQFSEFKDKIIEKKQKINNFYSVKLSEADEVFDKNTETQQNKKDYLQKLLSDLERKRDKINSQELYKEEIKNFTNEILEIDKQINNNTNQISILKNNIKNIQDKAGSEEKLLEKEYETEKDNLIRDFKIIETQIKEINQNLLSFENSFFKYLNDNYKGWEQNIAKVCDKRLLFKDNLKPKLKETNNTFYGVEIDLSEVESSIKTLKEYEDDKTALTNSLQKRKNELQKHNDKFEIDKANFIKSRNKKIAGIKRTIEQFEGDNYQIENKKNKIGIKLKDLQLKAKEEKIKLLAEISPKITDTQTQVSKTEKIIKEQKEIRQNRKDNINNEKTQKIEELNKKQKNEEIGSKNNLLKNKTDFKTKEQILKKEQIQELAGEGADTDKIKDIESDLSKIIKKLEIITKLRKEFVNKYEVEKIEVEKIPHFIEKKKGYNALLDKLKITNEKEFDTLTYANKKLKATFENIEKTKNEIQKDIEEFEEFEHTDLYKILSYYITKTDQSVKHEKLMVIVGQIKDIIIEINTLGRELKSRTDAFVSPFRVDNIFNFPNQFSNDSDCLRFADNLKEYIEEEKIEDVKQQVKKKYSSLIQYIVGDINLLASKRKNIDKTILEINKDFENSNFVSVIQEFEMKTIDTANKIVQVLFKIKEFHDNHTYDFGEPNLFSGQKMEENNQKSIKLLTSLLKNLKNTINPEINLEDIFELKFRAKQNNKDTGWKSKLSDVGSHGTDILLKAMIYIMLLNVFKEKASKKSKFKDFRLHCIMDEIGRIHSKNIKNLIKFANSRDIWMIFGSPEENDALAYKYVYDFEKQGSITTATRLIYDKRS